MKKIVLIFALVLNLTGLFSQTPGIEYGPYEALGIVDDARINEASGIARSNIVKNAFWLHNDSGDGPNLFMVDSGGNTLVYGVVEDASSRDWEDIASFTKNNKSYLLIGDVGDNPIDKSEYWMYLIKEPEYNPESKDANSYPIINKIRYQYEDGSQNSESIAVDTSSDKIIIITKTNASDCKAYELPLSFEQNPEIQTARIVAPVSIAGTTAMDISQDGHRAIVLTYQDAYEFTRYAGETWAEGFSHNPRQLTMPRRNGGEAICYGENGKTLYLATEGSSKPLWIVPAIDDTTGLVFQVDMQDESELYPGGAVWVNIPDIDSSIIMTDTDTNGIYICTFGAELGTDIIYYFSYQNGANPETDVKIESFSGSCIDSDGFRSQNVYIDYLTLVPVIFGGCTTAPEYITFQVDVSTLNDVYENGAIWVVMDNPDSSYIMSDPERDSIYFVVLPFLAGSNVNYRYAYQNGPDPESDIVEELVPDACNSEQNFRSFIVTSGDVTLFAVEFGSCDEVLPGGVDITDLEGTTIVGSNDNYPWIGPTEGSGSPPGEDVSNLIDNNINEKYLVRAINSWAAIKAQRYSLVTAYTITSANDAPTRDPKSWEFQGWDGINEQWDIIHTVENNPSWLERKRRKSWYFENDNSYSEYRLYITAINDDPQGLMQMAEFQIFGVPGEFTNVEKLATSEVLVFPNPTNGLVSIINVSEDKYSYEVYSLLGKLIFREEQCCGTSSIVDLSALAKGMYIIDITTKNERFAHKIVLK